MIAEAHYWYPVREKDRADVDIYPGMHPLRFGDERYPRRPPVRAASWRGIVISPARGGEGKLLC